MNAELTMDFDFIASTKDRIATISINRPSHANSFNLQVIAGFISCFKKLEFDDTCRIVIIKGVGKHFSAGADLKWMQASSKLSREENKNEAKLLFEMFDRLQRLPQATVAIVKGAAYGGALGLISACDIAFASSNSRFCLSEVSLGILPAVILPFLLSKMDSKPLKRLSMTARVFTGNEACNWGLVDYSLEENELNKKIKEEINFLLAAGPKAIGHLKKLFNNLQDNEKREELVTESIAIVRASKEAQHGFESFFAQEKPDWKQKLADEWTFDDDRS